ncbi:Protein of unknown function [Pyronema omphalodes CBS 100304]|uniref:Uncharacterized protein n=1 Tax=Pyronema omphalodes (strain CBS 100304) TaxID=1076935 RepID=U4LUK7_PYROM|nr:Protein of unknown function [Pyronema omphalodes CBS 100304]
MNDRWTMALRYIQAPGHSNGVINCEWDPKTVLHCTTAIPEPRPDFSATAAFVSRFLSQEEAALLDLASSHV